MTSNRLIREKSPYLLQHARNPVDWYPWGEEAFARAEREDKPIFLSVGYAACHWCHVMEKESFENEETAGYLNETFVCIKVDREERPDVDAVYMAACHILNKSGGWPLTVFMTPDKKPFFCRDLSARKKHFRTDRADRTLSAHQRTMAYSETKDTGFRGRSCRTSEPGFCIFSGKA